MTDSRTTVPLPVSNRGGPWRWLAALLLWTPCWLVTLGMGATATAWMLDWAPMMALRWVNAFTFYFYLPAYAVLLAALVGKRRWLATAATLIVAWHLCVVVPSIWPYQTAPVKPRDAASTNRVEGEALRVFYANVSKSSKHRDDLFEEIREADADVLVLTEFTEGWHNRFNAAELVADFPHHIHLAKYDPAATGVYSRYPLTEGDRVYQAKRVLVKARVECGPTGIDIYALHAPRPLNSPLHKYGQFWKIVRRELDERDPDQPLLLIGDYNATPYSLIYRSLTGQHGLSDCHVQCGRGVATTWPNGSRAMPPIRIDHALVSPRVRCLAITEGRGLGSDHRPLIVDLALPSR